MTAINRMLGRLSLSQLRALEAVVRTGSFSLAARDLGLAQPSVSNHVSAVENRFGVRLLDRDKLGIRASPVLASVLPQIRAVLTLGEDVERAIAASGALAGGRLRVCYSTYQIAMPLLAKIMLRHPTLSIEARAAATDDVLRALETGKADAGFITAREVPADLCGRLAMDSHIVLAVARDHPLANRGEITWAEIAELPLIQREKGSGTRRIFEAAATVAGVAVQTRLALGCCGSMAALVRRGAGAAVLQRCEIDPEDGLCPVEVVDSALSVRHFVVCPHELTRTAAVTALFAELDQDDISVSAFSA